MNENRFETVQSSLAALKAVHDLAVQGEAKKLEKNINAIIATNKPMVVAYVEQLKAFDASLLAKYGVPTARLIEFIICILTIICVLACFFYIGIMIGMAYIEFYCIALFSLLGFSFTPFQGTRSFGATAITGLVMSTIKLMVMTVTALLLVVALKDSVPKDYFDTTVESVAAGGNFQSVEEFAAAIRQVETGGCEDPYHTPSADGYGYGAYQISYSNWESWCAEAGISPAPDMPWPPEVQDVVAKHKMQVLYEQYGNWHDVAIVWNAGSVVSWDEAYWQKVINSGGTRVEKTIKLTVLLKMMLVAIAAMIFGHEDCKVIMELFAGYGFRFKRQGMIRGFRL